MVYTLLNMLFVPEPYLDNEELHAQADGRFGLADCFQWLQVYCREFEYAVCIPRREHYPAPDLLAWAWYTPILEDFVTLPTAAFAVGKLLRLGTPNSVLTDLVIFLFFLILTN